MWEDADFRPMEPPASKPAGDPAVTPTRQDKMLAKFYRLFEWENEVDRQPYVAPPTWWLWCKESFLRFLPDALLCWIGIMLSDLPFTLRTPITRAFRLVLIPSAVAFYIYLMCQARFNSRKNISRWLCETRPIRFLGKISYPAYMFQIQIAWFYFPVLTSIFVHHHDSPLREYSSHFVLHMFWIYTLCLLLFIVFFAWLVQTFYQEKFVMYMYSKALVWFHNFHFTGCWGMFKANVGEPEDEPNDDDHDAIVNPY
jgi:hypothetical protein